MELDFNNLDELTVLFEELEFRNFLNRFSLLAKNNDETLKEEENKPVENEKTNDTQFDLFSNIVPEIKLKTGFNIKSNTKTISTIKDLTNFFEVNSQEDILVFNFIYDKDNTSSLGLSFKENEFIFINLINSSENYTQLLKQIFEDLKITKISYNIKSQIKILDDLGIALVGSIFDINIAHYILHPDMRHNLDVISENYLSLSIESDKELLRKSPNKNTLTYLSSDKLTEVSSQRIQVIQSLYPIFLKN